MSNQYSTERIRKAILHFLTGRILQAGLSMFFLFWLVRLLSVQDYGVYVSIIGMVELSVSLFSFGLLEAAQRFIPQVASAGDRKSLRKIMSWLLIRRVLSLVAVSLVIYWQWPRIAMFLSFPNAHHTSLRFASFLVTTIVLFRYLAEILEALLEQARSQYLRAMEPLFKLSCILSILILNNSLTVNIMVNIELLCSGLLCCTAFYAVYKSAANVDKKNDQGNTAYPTHIASFCWQMTPVTMTKSLTSEGLVRLVISRVLGIEAVAIYGFLQRLQAIVARYLPSMLLRNLIRPVLISQYHNENRTESLQLSTSLFVKINLILIGLLINFILIFPEDFVSLLSGGKFNGVDFLLLLLLFSTAIASNRLLIEMVMQIANLTQLLRKLSFIAIPIFLCLLFCAKFGLVAITTGLIMFAVIWNSLAMILLKKRLADFTLDFMGIGIVALSMVGPGLLSGILKWYGVPPYGCSFVVLITFPGILFLGKPILQGELLFLFSTLGIKCPEPVNRLLVRN